MTQNIKISKIKPNSGQIEGLSSNPRFIRDEKFNSLKKSLEDDPEMLSLRELIVIPFRNDFIIIGGNMRYRAAIELGFEELPCKVLNPDTPIDKLRAITIKDNIPYGQWDMNILVNEWDIEELEDWGLDIDNFNCKILDDLEKGNFMGAVKETSTIFSITFSFDKSYKECIDNYINKNSKDLLTDLIIKICQGAEVK